jgi:mannose-6-phosphate isomerase-like protein (cupin superfamily)
MTEALLTRRDGGWLEADGEGWYVLNAQDARWLVSDDRGAYTNFEGSERWPEFGFNINWLPPGAPMAMYHDEPMREGFFVLDGEAILIIEGEERPLKRWDYVHCPRDVSHTIIGAGENGALTLGEPGGGFPFDATALKHGAGVEVATGSAKEAYARFAPMKPSAYPDGVLPD